MSQKSIGKPKPAPERCPKCKSTELMVTRERSWPSVVCADCGTFVRDFGD